jgi:hypothetical protein
MYDKKKNFQRTPNSVGWIFFVDVLSPKEYFFTLAKSHLMAHLKLQEPDLVTLYIHPHALNSPIGALKRPRYLQEREREDGRLIVWAAAIMGYFSLLHINCGRH